VGLVAFVLSASLLGSSGMAWVDPFIWSILAVSATAILVATGMGIWVRRSARGRYRRPWRTATQALWLAWSPWVVGYVGGVLIGPIISD
jgi:hypothetical protein